MGPSIFYHRVKFPKLNWPQNTDIKSFGSDSILVHGVYWNNDENNSTESKNISVSAYTQFPLLDVKNTQFIIKTIVRSDNERIRNYAPAPLAPCSNEWFDYRMQHHPSRVPPHCPLCSGLQGEMCLLLRQVHLPASCPRYCISRHASTCYAFPIFSSTLSFTLKDSLLYLTFISFSWIICFCFDGKMFPKWNFDESIKNRIIFWYFVFLFISFANWFL